LNTSIALSVLFELVRLANALLEETTVTKETLNEVDDLFRNLGGEVLGIVKDEYTQITMTEHQKFAGIVDSLIKQRNEARKRKDFKTADEIRQTLTDSDITIMDEPDGTTTWR